MRNEDILARADAALGRVNNMHRPAETPGSAKPYVNRWIQMAIVVGAILLILAFLSAPFTIIAVAALIAAAGYALSRLKPGGNAKAKAQDLPKEELGSLPLKVELWLASQRRMLPAAAQSLADSICKQLKTLASQIAGVSNDDPLAHDIRRLLAVELPELIADYFRVPAAVRKTASDGFLPDKQLTQGLIVIDSRLEQINAAIAAAPVTKLATQARYLDLKYQDNQK